MAPQSRALACMSLGVRSAQNDSGLFEVNFRDERYLPFEGAGLISTWQLDMPQDCNAFDFDTITDVVINLRYTARYGGDRLRDFARAVAILPPRPAQSYSGSTVPYPAKQTNPQRLFSLRHEFPSEWYKFLHPAATANVQSMSIAVGNERFPFQYRGKIIVITQAELVLVFCNPRFQASFASNQLALSLGPPPAPGPGAPPPAPGAPPPAPNTTLKSNPSILNGAGYYSLPRTFK
jgi:hypothetical protein